MTLLPLALMYNWHLATLMHFSQSALLPQSLVLVDLPANLCHACGLPEVSVYLLAGTDEDAEYLEDICPHSVTSLLSET